MEPPTPPKCTIENNVKAALAEDIGPGDINALLIPESRAAHARVICREHAVLAGLPWAREVFRQLDENLLFKACKEDGDSLRPNDIVFELEGSARPILSGERSALNFLQCLSATATRSAEYKRATTDFACEILDTRKTLPGLRLAQKYAVRCGGAQNHRFGLYDAYLIKENHIMAYGSIDAVINAARKRHKDKKIEIEVENLDELGQALTAGADIVMLDNFNLEDTRKAVTLTRGRCLVEASGGIDLNTLETIAATGVDYISVGSLTKDIKAVDFSMRFSTPA